MKTSILALVLSSIFIFTTTANALTPSFHIREGFSVLLKEGGVPGPVSTRFDFTLGQKLSEKIGGSVGLGLSTPNDLFKPSPRMIVGMSFKFADRWSVHTTTVLQHNIGFGGKNTTDTVALVTGSTFTIADGLSLSLSTGLAKTIHGDWSALFQPTLSVAF